jgi:pyrroloquinoline quinone (PQQ) biosynthesis protein C
MGENVWRVLSEAQGRVSEADVWAALAEDSGVDVSEIMDGDLAEWL